MTTTITTATATTEPTGKDRYVILPNEDGTYSVRDLLTWQYLTDRDGNEDLTWTDAHDLQMEYIG